MSLETEHHLLRAVQIVHRHNGAVDLAGGQRPIEIPHRAQAELLRREIFQLPEQLDEQAGIPVRNRLFQLPGKGNLFWRIDPGCDSPSAVKKVLKYPVVQLLDDGAHGGNGHCLRAVNQAFAAAALKIPGKEGNVNGIGAEVPEPAVAHLERQHVLAGLHHRGLAGGHRQVIAFTGEIVGFQLPPDLIGIALVHCIQEVIEIGAAGVVAQPVDGQLEIPGQLRIFNGLQAVADDTVGQCLLGIGKFREAADDDGLDITVQLKNALAQGKAVHIRHADVRDDDIHRIGVDVLQRLHPAHGHGSHVQPQALPIDAVLHGVGDGDFIIHQKYLKHEKTPRFLKSFVINWGWMEGYDEELVSS